MSRSGFSSRVRFSRDRLRLLRPPQSQAPIQWLAQIALRWSLARTSTISLPFMTEIKRVVRVSLFRYFLSQGAEGVDIKHFAETSVSTLAQMACSWKTNRGQVRVFQNGEDEFYFGLRIVGAIAFRASLASSMARCFSSSAYWFSSASRRRSWFNALPIA